LTSQAAIWHGRDVNPSHLVLRDLCCRLGGQEIVCAVSLELSPGEHVALLGGNGAGKSTLLRAILGLAPVHAGSILVDGRRQPRPCPASWARTMAWIPQRPPRGEIPFPLRELLAHPRAWAWGERLGLGALQNRPLSQLSGGELQRAYVARALGQVDAGAGLLLADEPTAALDFSGQNEVGEILSALPVTLLLVTHDPAQARRCHRSLTMAQGRIRSA
jgi:ABC-type cobalamin/Fe3+-siderophores transport system ATPase subunit